MTTTPAVAFGKPVPVPRGGRVEFDPARFRRNADSMPDGEHLIGVTNTTGSAAFGDAPSGQIVVVVNWFDEVRRTMSGR